MIITMRDIRSCGMCSGGARVFFNRHGLDWNEFLKNGIDSKKIEETGDWMALKVVEAARGRQ